MQKFKNCITLICAATLIVGCSTVGVTGRSQLNFVSDEALINASNANWESFIQGNSQKDLVLKPDSPENAAILNSANRASSKIIVAAGLQNQRNWQVVVIKSDIPNAFVLPNGKIVIYTGILKYAQTEAGLAAIIGHEVAHVSAKHSAERVSQVILANAIVDAAGAAIAVKNPKYQPAISAALGMGATFGYLMPFNRNHESEADYIGQIYMAKAGYNPAAAIEVWNRMSTIKTQSKFDFFSTHPSSDSRQEALTSSLASAQIYYSNPSLPLPKTIAETDAFARKKASNSELAPEAHLPDITDGYWYKLQRPDGVVTVKYLGLTKCEYGRCLRFVGSDKSSRVMTTDLSIVRTTSSTGEWTEYSPPLRLVAFPIATGDAWSDVVTVTKSDGTKKQVTFQTAVLDFEQVKLPIGNVPTYKIVQSANGVKSFEGWYLNDLGWFAATRSPGKQGQQKTFVLEYGRKDSRPTAQ